MSEFIHDSSDRAHRIRGLIAGRSYAPHCDSRVLHAPTECWSCDGYPDWQQARNNQGINFTGKYDEERVLCPSEHMRDLETINRWPNNRPAPLPEEPKRKKRWFG